MKSYATILAIFLLGVTWMAAPASADTVYTWNLQGVTFDDGATATGSFTFDQFYANLTDFDIVVTGGGWADHEYSLPDTNGFGDNTGANFSDTQSLVLTFTPHLDVAGLESTITGFEDDHQSDTRDIVAGTAVLVTSPEPGTVLMFGAGFAGLVLLRTRKGAQVRQAD